MAKKALPTFIIRLDGAEVERADKMIPRVQERLGNNADRSDVLRLALVAGLVCLNDKEGDARAKEMPAIASHAGRGVPRLTSPIQVGFRVDPAQLERADWLVPAISARDGEAVSRSQVMREAIGLGLDELEKTG
jgi:hypothetical protein